MVLKSDVLNGFFAGTYSTNLNSALKQKKTEDFKNCGFKKNGMIILPEIKHLNL